MSTSVGSFSQSATGTSGYTTGSGFANVLPGLGIPIFIDNNPAYGPSMGGGIKGRMPQSVLDHDNSNSFAQTRFTLVNAFNTSKNTGSSYPKRILTPFRAINNAGDLLVRQNYSCGGSCQTPQSRPGLYGLKMLLVQHQLLAKLIFFGLQLKLTLRYLLEHVMLNMFMMDQIIQDLRRMLQ